MYGVILTAGHEREIYIYSFIFNVMNELNEHFFLEIITGEIHDG